MKAVVTTEGEIRRSGFRFEPTVLRAVIPPAAVGTYCLLVGERPIYIGRSDRCVQARLCRHDLAGKATHFMWEPAQSPWHAFCHESYWWHRLEEFPGLTNLIHPGRPTESDRGCPFCGQADAEALELLLDFQENEDTNQTGPVPH